ncbi:aldose 1-epimerase family protein [Blastococcus sp. VKM Ac-2987]|uniref:aldose 1-epimerase family protein n=1 Tax=Blastococcus sp. VKM Ac-2987 TaxID=3004141 RepID=UPI0022AB5B6C|nr:aldose 1-epimerase family protein [Blastococcus sp. VKM Ac-2987]MCZ2858775.1 aldose 1-epimerase family protein [Blastococcus sp. VKM Ac-2987]
MPDTWPDADRTEVELTAGDARLAVDLRGGTLRRLAVGGWEVLDGYAAGTVAPGWRGAVLVPWPNRLRHGRWTWAGEELQLEVRSPEEPHAIHGLVGWQPWEVLGEADGSVTVGTTVEPHPGYPFRLDVAVDHRLTADRLTSTLRVRNPGGAPAPFGAGFHPYLSVGATADGGIGAAELTLPARTELVLDGGLPTGERRPVEGAVGEIGDRPLDAPLTDLDRDADGWAHVRLRGSAGELVISADASWPWLQVYSGDDLPAGQRRRSLAVEPMTCPPNALADGVDLITLGPGETWSGTWSLAWTPEG